MFIYSPKFWSNLNTVCINIFSLFLQEIHSKKHGHNVTSPALGHFSWQIIVIGLWGKIELDTSAVFGFYYHDIVSPGILVNSSSSCFLLAYTAIPYRSFGYFRKLSNNDFQYQSITILTLDEMCEIFRILLWKPLRGVIIPRCQTLWCMGSQSGRHIHLVVIERNCWGFVSKGMVATD